MKTEFFDLEMVGATKADEPGTKNYEWFIGEDGNSCHIHELYVDSAAVMTHLANLGRKFADRFGAVRQEQASNILQNASAISM